MGYRKATIRGISWITLLRIITRIVTFLRLIILGRLLSPAQFGYFGVASLVLTLLEILTETGINIFLIQLKGNMKHYLSAAWTVSIIRGIILFLVVIAMAYPVASFFDIENAIHVIFIVALVPLIRGFVNPAIIQFQKELQFSSEFKLRTTLFFVDAFVAVILGFVTRDASSFALGVVASSIIEVILSFLLVSSRPIFKFEINKILKIVKRGFWINATGLSLYFADNGDNLVVGKLLGSTQLGIYQVAYKFSTMPISEITVSVNQVIFPVYSKFSNDRKRLLRAFMKISLITSVGSIILGGVIFVTSDFLITLFMGDQWRAAVPVIQILAVYGILRTVFGNFSPLFISCERQDYVAKSTFLRALGLLIFIIPSISYFGLTGAGVAMLASILFEIPLIAYFAIKIFKN